ncbi:ATPase inhibitor subunit zeta [Sinorhizobium sp. 7-81]|uniref:ATPase inhibitor subunit zeta n=1 Tax=Sinorhizobium sp. 8-89 TaxID=3049089 RepID=UPI0024C43240|nr:ATPase inhibitor subunit zeta [Sinorhizobium sp. 8-89]MDK1491229.1 ATPase inhibitor subunit zeta [Sinorhizobium sp. 8-89]
MELTEREKALEERYILDFERSLRVRERRNRLLAGWAARALDRSNATAYAAEIAEAGRAEAGDDDVLRKVLRDFEIAGIAATREQLEEKMRALLFVAAEQLDARSKTERR